METKESNNDDYDETINVYTPSVRQRFPYTYTTSPSRSGFIVSIFKWFFEELLSSILIIILYPLLIPFYIIVVIDWYRRIVLNRKQGTTKLKSFVFYTIYTLISLCVAPILYFLSDGTVTATFAFLPTVLFFAFRKSVLLRLARWYLRSNNDSAFFKRQFPKWALNYFIQNGIYLHYILIKEYCPRDIYLHLFKHLKGEFSIFNAETKEFDKIPVEKFMVNYKFAVNCNTGAIVMLSVIIAAVVVIYNVLIGSELFGASTVLICVWVLILLMIIWQLLMISLKFSSLQSRHLRFLHTQQLWAQQSIFDLIYKLKENDYVDELHKVQIEKKMNYLQKSKELINAITTQIEIIGLSPKIAGIPMSGVFVKFTWSLAISAITAGIGFYLRNLS